MSLRGAACIVFGVLGVTAACGGSEAPGGSGTAGSKADAGDGGDDRGGASPGGKGGSTGGSDVGGEGGGGDGMGGAPQAGAGMGLAGAGQPSDVEPRAVTFEVVASEEVRPISPLIYGANLDSVDCADSKARFTFCRRRSAAWSTYNWENNASNAGAGDCNENNDALSASATPGAAMTDLIELAEGAGAATVLTLPMLPYVAADKNGGSAAPGCSGDVANTADYLATRFKQNRARKGSALSLVPDTGDQFVNGDELVAFLHDGYPDSTLLFGLDSQTELWEIEHPRVRTTPLGYDELIALSVEYATMVKDTWPEAEVIGFGGYGYLAALSLQLSPDAETQGELWSYYLSQLRQASENDGRRLVDYIDLHWFSEVHAEDQRIILEASGPESVAARVQATRSLWDPDYVEPNSFISNVNGGQPIELLTWLGEAIDDHYAGTKLAISEWSFGGGRNISGAIAAADALGIFGRYGVALAGAVSFSPQDEPYLLGAFQAYRNYDGNDGAFGDTSVLATSSDVELGSVYASVDQADPTRLVIVAINRYAGELVTTLSIDSDTAYTSVTPYRIFDGQPEPLVGAASAAVSANTFELTIPPYSIWVLVPSS